MCFHSEILTTTVVCLFIAAVGFALIMVLAMPKRRPALVPISVNYHLTRVCNYNCKFCFHTNTTRYVCTLEDAKRGMKLLLEKGTKKINFSGGEPFMVRETHDGQNFVDGEFVGELCKYCKGLGMSVSIICNGSLVTDGWFDEYGTFVDIFGVSVDSFDPDRLEIIGRTNGKLGASREHLQKVFAIKKWCDKSGILFKINTVVTTATLTEDMVPYLLRLQPSRWKVFQCLLMAGENIGPAAKRNAEPLLVSKEQFKGWLARHAECNPVAEDNGLMQNSYLILDEELRFLNCEGGRKKPTKSILEVGVAEALLQAGHDSRSFQERGGVYNWLKGDRKRVVEDIEEPSWDIEDTF